MLLRTEEDAAIEASTARTLSKAWHCEVRSFGGRDEIDFYAIRHERLVAVMELKARKVTHLTYPTVFLSMRKYMDLRTYGHAMKVRAIFVVQFTDGLFWIDIGDVDPSRHRMGGNSRNLAFNDYEPMIEVPIESLHRVADGVGPDLNRGAR